MAETFNYFSHQKFTPNYIHGIDGEYENVSSATSEAACTAALEAGNNIMFTGAMGIIDWSATNEVPRKDMTYKTGSSMTGGHYINGKHTTINVQSGASCMRMFIFDDAHGSQINAIGGADFTNINFLGSGNDGVTVATDDTVGAQPYTFQGTGHETSVVHAGEMAINSSGSGDHTRGDTTDGAGTFHCGYENYDFFSGPSDHRLQNVDTNYRAVSGQSPDFVDIRNARVGMTNASKRPSGLQVNPGIWVTARESDYYYVNNLLSSDSNWASLTNVSSTDKFHLMNCVSSGYTDASSDHEVGRSVIYEKSMINSNQLVEGDGNSTLDTGGFYLYQDDNLATSNMIEMLSLAAAGTTIYIDSGSNDVLVYGNSIQSNNTSYGDIDDDAGDGTVAGNNSTT